MPTLDCKKDGRRVSTIEKLSQNIPEMVVADYVIWILSLRSGDPELEPQSQSAAHTPAQLSIITLYPAFIASNITN